MASRPQPRVDAPCSACDRILPTRQGLRRHLRTVHGIVETTRTCTTCGVDKDSSYFGVIETTPAGYRKYRSSCDDCRVNEAAAAAFRRAARPESHKRRDRKRGIARTFGLTVEEYDAAWETFLREQGGLCAVCQAVEPDRLDHDHENGRLRGLLCHACNVAAGFLRDEPERVERLAVYLRKVGQ